MGMTRYYILRGREPVLEPDIMAWSNWYADLTNCEAGQVARDEIGAVVVSTVFLGIDHGHGRGEPILFETMVFGLEDDEPQWRYSTWGEAEKGHREAIRYVYQMLDARNNDRLDNASGQ